MFEYFYLQKGPLLEGFRYHNKKSFSPCQWTQTAVSLVSNIRCMCFIQLRLNFEFPFCLCPPVRILQVAVYSCKSQAPLQSGVLRRSLYPNGKHTVGAHPQTSALYLLLLHNRRKVQHKEQIPRLKRYSCCSRSLRGVRPSMIICKMGKFLGKFSSYSKMFTLNMNKYRGVGVRTKWLNTLLNTS